MTIDKHHGETDLAQAMMSDLGDAPDDQFLVFSDDCEIVSMPAHMRDEFARIAAKEVADKLLGGADSAK